MLEPTRPKRRKQGPEDVAETAFRVFEDFLTEADPPPAKNEALAEAGRRGGLKGGNIRAAQLTPERRREIAKKAAAARWRR